MARALVLLLALGAVGCTDGDTPPLLVTDFGVSLDGGGTCSTACDCPAGQACRMGMCQAGAAMVFCCTAMSCMGSAACQFPDGKVGQCDRADGGGIPPVVDMGAPVAQCEMTSCTPGIGGNVFCKLACGGSSATCVKTGGIEHCTP